MQVQCSCQQQGVLFSITSADVKSRSFTILCLNSVSTCATSSGAGGYAATSSRLKHTKNKELQEAACSEQHLDKTPNLVLQCHMLHFLVQVEMQLPAAGWGVMNITSAGLQRWSFTDSVAEVAQPIRPQVRSELSLVTMVKIKDLNDCGLLLGTCLLLSGGTEGAAVSQCDRYCTELFCSAFLYVVHVTYVNIANSNMMCRLVG